MHLTSLSRQSPHRSGGQVHLQKVTRTQAHTGKLGKETVLWYYFVSKLLRNTQIKEKPNCRSTILVSSSFCVPETLHVHFLPDIWRKRRYLSERTSAQENEKQWSQNHRGLLSAEWYCSFCQIHLDSTNSFSIFSSFRTMLMICGKR